MSTPTTAVATPRATRAYLARYILAAGTRGTLTLIAATAFDAVDAALSALGADVRLLSVRPAP